MKSIHVLGLVVLVGSNTLQSSAQTALGFTKSYHTYQTTRIPVYIFEPATQDPLIHYPLVLCLHGSGECGDDSTVLAKNSLASVWVDSANQASWPCMVVVPQCPLDGWWSDPMMLSTLNNLLDSLVAQHRIDTNRIYLTGLSMGGAGTWDLAARYPERFAAGVIVCGFGDPSCSFVLRTLPLWFFHGARDPNVPVEYARAMVAAIESTGVVATRTEGLSDSVVADRISKGADLLYTEYPSGYHDVWDKAYHHPLLFPWVFSKTRPATSTLMYVRNVEAFPFTPRTLQDTVRIRTTVNNPGGLPLAVTAYLTDLGGSQPRDSLQLLDDGMHEDGAAGDGVWGGTVGLTPEGATSVSVSALDLSTTRSSILTAAAFFATDGLISIDKVLIMGGDTSANPGDVLRYLIFLKNQANSVGLNSVSAIMTSPDTTVIVQSDLASYGNLAPGASKAGSRLFTVQYSAARPGAYSIPLTVRVGSLGVLFWSYQIVEEVTAAAQPGECLANVFALDQNYPNPFNPSTTIRYGLPTRLYVMLTVFNTLGQQVATLVQGEEEAGYHEAVFDASRLASGVSLYRVQARDFVQSRRLVLVR